MDCATKKRDRLPPTTSSCILSDAALGLSNTCRRATAAESITLKRPSLQPPPPAPPQQTPRALSDELTNLRESLRAKEKECADFSVRMSKLSQSHLEVERRLATAHRELLVLQADQTMPPTLRHPPPPHIPINTQGKDALYWHQACRTLQRQYTEMKHELENKTDQFVRLNDSYRAVLKRLEEAGSQRGTETLSQADTRRS